MSDARGANKSDPASPAASSPAAVSDARGANHGHRASPAARSPAAVSDARGANKSDPASPAARIVVLASGSGSTLQAILDASADPSFGASVAAVGTDRDGIGALDRARAAGADTFVLRVTDFPERADWDRALTERVAAYRPDLVVSAGFMKLVGAAFLERFGGRYLNSHPALLPSFPGMHGPRDALEHGVKVSGCTLFVVDAGVDTGPIVAQVPVPVLDDDDEVTLHERIKSAERQMLVEYVGRMCREGWTVTGRRVSVP